HMQHAQPVLLAHHLLAYIEMFNRDAERLCDCLKRVDVMPLGSGALAGTTFPIDREFTARELGFAAISANSMDSVSDRDHLVELLSALSLIMVHLSRLSEEMVLWSSPEFGFVEIGDAFTTGSSIMPQKKNPDVAELVRGRSGRVFGHLMGMLTVLKGLPMTYNRDLQEDKEGLFDALDTVGASLAVYASMIRATEFKPEKMADALKADFSDATDVADYLVRRGMSFREAHEVVGNMVRYCLDERKALSSLRPDELQRFSTLFDDTIYDALGTMNIIDARKHPGGTARASVTEALKETSERLRRG
ncbi:MAG: argininosuccinate lyase, partial [bacterium]|nr:argininosuccinate lyase [bacterium]